MERIAFRFAVLYLGLYCLISSVLHSIFVLPFSSPGTGLGTAWPLRETTSWVAVHMLGMTGPLLYTGNSRDTNFYWAQIFLVLLIAIGGTILWSIVDRRRDNYDSLHHWLRLFIRFALAAQMIYFGMLKVIPTQFTAPSLLTLVTPAGNLSLQAFLWTSIGASPGYEIFTGVVEVLGGLLLIIPNTVVLGSAICLATMFQVFVLNLSYDIGVKILSFQLVLMSTFLLAPDFRRLMSALVHRRPARNSRVALAAQVAVGIYLLVVYANIGRILWYTDGGGSPRSPLYGIWNVEELSVDGEVRPANINDYDRRWRRIIFDSPQWIFFQRTDDSFARYGVHIDSEHRTLALTKGHSRSWHSDFSFERSEPDRLLLNGEMDGHKISARLQLLPLDTFRLLNSSFRWIRPPDAESE